MKRLMAAAAAVALFGCEMRTVEEEADLKSKFENEETFRDDDLFRSRMSRIEWEGHVYVRHEGVSRTAYGYVVKSASITHDPDCPCAKKETDNGN